MAASSKRASILRARTLRRQKQREARAVGGQQQAKRPVVANIIALALLLIVGTFFLYSSVSSHSFTYYDDNIYVIDNPHVTAGLSWNTICWSLTSTEHSNWHPLTWMSHALDCQLFGLDSGYHHITNLVIHIFNSLLLFLLLRQATGATGRSFIVAALFAWHPLNVESVAWIAERKNLLSMLFFLLTLSAYVWYTRKPAWERFVLVLLGFVAALGSKPMAVTLPFVLLLLDYWPLRRISGQTSLSSTSAPQQTFRSLLLEKLSLFGLSAASCVITILAQRRAVRPLQVYSLGARVVNALVSYVVYIEKTFLPARLAVYYPLIPSFSFWKAAIAATVVGALSVLAWQQRSTRPYLFTGWFWFLGTLVPVIGIVQVGDQAMADRYAYLPLVGLFVLTVWSVAECAERWNVKTVQLGLAAMVTLGTLAFLSTRQLSYWKDDVTLWDHALQVTPENETAESQLATAFIFRGDHDSALPHLINITKLDPTNIWPYGSIGAGYLSAGRTQEAILEFERVIRLSDHANLTAREKDLRSSAFLNLGFAAISLNDYARALTSFQRANELDSANLDQAIKTVQHSVSSGPTLRDYLELPLLLKAKGEDRAALSVLQRAISANPEYQEIRSLWSYLETGPTADQSPVRSF
jgi:protein O-mannosyl-transferase